MPPILRIALLALAAGLAACGQKGDLYLPDAAREVVPPATTSPGGGPAGAQGPAVDEDEEQNAGNAARPAGDAR